MFKKGSIAIFAVLFLMIIAGVIIIVKSRKNIPANNTEVPTVAVTAASTPPATPSKAVSLPAQEDVIRLFFQLINDQKASEAVAMLSQSAAPDDSTRQMWGVNFNSIKSVKIKSLEKNGDNQFKVMLDMVMKNGEAYNWTDGENLRWINLMKEGDLWKIEGIATGP